MSLIEIIPLHTILLPSLPFPPGSSQVHMFFLLMRVVIFVHSYKADSSYLMDYQNH